MNLMPFYFPQGCREHSNCHRCAREGYRERDKARGLGIDVIIRVELDLDKLRALPYA